MSDDDAMLDFLERIDAGDVKWVSGCQCAWDDMYAGNVEFVSSSGDKLIVFNDCGDWDHIDSVVVGGRKVVPCKQTRRLIPGWAPRGWSVMRMIEPQYLTSPLNEDKSNCPCKAGKP